MEWSLNIVMGMGIKPQCVAPRRRYPLSFVQKESPLKSGYESSGDPRGRLTNRFHIGGRGG